MPTPAAPLVSTPEQIARHQKLTASLRYFLLGAASQAPDYYRAVDALQFASEHHRGLRKDGSPEFIHQVESTLFLTGFLPVLRHPVDTLIAQLLHDTHEDYNVPFDEISRRYGVLAADAVKFLSKVRNGLKLPTDAYFAELVACPIASVCKGADRVNNQSTMSGAFTLAKQREYITETQEHILPMLKQARRLHPSQTAVYEQLKFTLSTQVSLVKATLAVAEAR